MKKTLTVLLVGLFLIGITVIAAADPIDFNVSQENSSVTVTDVYQWGWADLDVALVDSLESEEFTLDEGESYTFDFFRLSASGLIGGGRANISATLAFDSPAGIEGTGEGGGGWFTFFGVLSGGILNWDPLSLPDYFALSNGNTVSIDFEDVYAVGFGDSVTVQATVANIASVPEPTTMLLMGIGLACFAGVVLKRNK